MKKLKIIGLGLGIILITLLLFQTYDYINNKYMNLEQSQGEKLYLDLGYASDSNNYEGRFELAADNKVQELGKTTGMTEDILLKKGNNISYSDSQRDYEYNQKTRKIRVDIRNKKELSEITKVYSGSIGDSKIGLYNYGYTYVKGHSYENRLYYNYKGKNVQYKIYDRNISVAYIINNQLYVISSVENGSTTFKDCVFVIDKYIFSKGRINHKEIVRKKILGDSFTIRDNYNVLDNNLYTFISGNNKVYLINLNLKTEKLNLTKTNIDDDAAPDIITINSNKTYYLTADNDELGILDNKTNKVISEKKISNCRIVPNMYHIDKKNNKLYTLEYWDEKNNNGNRVRLREVDILTGKSHLVKGLDRIELKGYNDMAILDFYYEKK